MPKWEQAPIVSKPKWAQAPVVNAPAQIGDMAVPDESFSENEQYRRAGIDTTTGGSIKARTIAGAASRPEDALASARKIYPDAMLNQYGKIVFTNPDTGRPTLLNPMGFDVGDVPSVTPELAGMAGSAAGAWAGGKAGAALGATIGSAFPGPGTAVGAGLGALVGGVIGAGAGGAVGSEVGRLPGKAMGAVDTRTMAETAEEMAVTAAIDGIGQGIGPVATLAAKGAAKPIFRSGAGKEAVDAFKEIGSSPLAEQAGRSGVNIALKGLALTPGGQAARIAATARQEAEVQSFVRGLAAKMSGGADKGPLAAGAAVQSGITNDFIPKFKLQSAKEFNEARQLAQDVYTDFPETMAVAKQLMQPAADAPAISKEVLASPATKRIIDSLRKDLEAAKSAGNPGLRYSTAEAIRSTVGNALGDTALLEKAPRSQLKKLYSALSDDMENALAASGNMDALAAFQKARVNYGRGRDLIDNFLQPLVDQKIPERVYTALESSMKEGPTRISNTIKALSPEQIGILRATVIDRAGRAAGNAQDETGERWILETFLSRWENFDPKAKAALFPADNEYAKSLDALAKAASIARKGNKTAANPSGTAQAFTNVQGMVGVGAALATGDLTVASAVFTSLYAAPYFGVRVVNNPSVVRLLAETPTIRPNGFGAWAGRLWAASANEDEETRAMVRDFIGKTGQEVLKGKSK